MKVETCENCERIIGKLEQAYIHSGKVVCENCKQILAQELGRVSQSTPLEVVTVEDGKKAKNISLPLKELKPAKFILYVVAIFISMFAVEFILTLVTGGKMVQMMGLVPSIMILMFSYCVLGLAIADLSYNIKKFSLVLVISVGTFFLVRFLLMVILIGLDKATVRTLMATTAMEAITVFLSAAVFRPIFRFTEPKFNFAEIHDIEKDLVNPKTEEKYDMGVCSKCGTKIIIAHQRFISVLGKSEKHFCDYCGTFLRTNPLKAMLEGLAESIISLVFLLLILGVMRMSEQGATDHHNSYQSIFLIILLVGIFDGINRIFAGTMGIIKSQKNISKK